MRRKKLKKRGVGFLQKYLNFDRMITPTIIKILFWVGVGISVLAGIIAIFSGLAQIFSRYGSGMLGFITFIMGFVIMILGTLGARIYCELLIVVFKMHESLHSIDEKLIDSNQKDDSLNVSNEIE